MNQEHLIAERERLKLVYRRLLALVANGTKSVYLLFVVDGNGLLVAQNVVRQRSLAEFLVGHGQQPQVRHRSGEQRPYRLARVGQISFVDLSLGPTHTRVVQFVLGGQGQFVLLKEGDQTSLGHIAEFFSR